MDGEDSVDATFRLIPAEVELTHLAKSRKNQHDEEARLDRLTRRFQKRHESRGGERARSSDSDLDQAEVGKSRRTEGRGIMDSSLGLDSLKRTGRVHAVQLRRNLIETCAVERKLRTNSEIIREQPIPTLSLAFGSIFGPPDLSRKLKPQRNLLVGKSTQVPKLIPHMPTEVAITVPLLQIGLGACKLLINIQQANNLPERVSGEPARVFVEVRFQNQCVQTTVVEGRHANWQETLYLSIYQDDDMRGRRGVLSNFDFKQIADYMELSLFDQILTQLDFDDREANTLHQQMERRWLGSVKIPFATVYALGKIDGLVDIEAPLFHTGYRFALNLIYL